MRFILALVLALMFTACSNQQIYTAVQENRRQECSKLVSPQYEECMRELETPYEEYARERQDMLQDAEK